MRERRGVHGNFTEMLKYTMFLGYVTEGGNTVCDLQQHAPTTAVAIALRCRF